MSFTFTSENIEHIEKLKVRYPKPQALNLPLLWLAQYQEGYISLEAIETIASISQTPPMEVYRVATFYTMFHLEHIGKYHIQVCKTLSCMLCGKEEIVSYLEQKLNIKRGETTPDRKFTLSQVECLGSCGTAPMMQLNDQYYENLTPEKIDQILGALQ